MNEMTCWTQKFNDLQIKRKKKKADNLENSKHICGRRWGEMEKQWGWNRETREHYRTWFVVPAPSYASGSLRRWCTLVLGKGSWAQLNTQWLTSFSFFLFFCPTAFVLVCRGTHRALKIPLSPPYPTPTYSCTQISFSWAVKHWVVKFLYASCSPRAPRAPGAF